MTTPIAPPATDAAAYQPPAVDPCLPGRGSDPDLTLYFFQPCGPDNPTMKVYCSDPANVAAAHSLYADGFDVCAPFYGPTKVATIVATPRHLPTTGYASGSIAALGLFLVVIGASLTRKVRRS